MAQWMDGWAGSWQQQSGNGRQLITQRRRRQTANKQTASIGTSLPWGLAEKSEKRGTHTTNSGKGDDGGNASEIAWNAPNGE